MNGGLEQFIVDSKGKKNGGTSFSQALSTSDGRFAWFVAVVAERRKEKPVSLEEMKRRLKKDDIV